MARRDRREHLAGVTNHVMLDLETLGTRPGSVILSIGAVEFDLRVGLGREFYVEISQYSSRHIGFTVDQDTVDWWEEQSAEARGLLARTSSGGLLPHVALQQFNAWLSPDPLVWGNGAAFDNALLREACARCWVGVSPRSLLPHAQEPGSGGRVGEDGYVPPRAGRREVAG